MDGYDILTVVLYSCWYLHLVSSSESELRGCENQHSRVPIWQIELVKVLLHDDSGNNDLTSLASLIHIGLLNLTMKFWLTQL